MPRLDRPVTPITSECSNLKTDRHRESPDLVKRYVAHNFVEVGIIDVGSRNDTDSPANQTDIIVSDDDTPSFHSDVTTILDPDIIIDYEGKPATHEDLDSLSTAGCSISEIAEQPKQKNKGWIRCKPIKDLLADEIVSLLKVQKNNDNKNGINHKKFDLIKNRKILKNNSDTLERFDSESLESSSSSSSSSSSPPPSPIQLRLRPRRRKIEPSSNESNTELNVIKKPCKYVRTEAARKPEEYHLLMKKLLMHKTTPLTSKSDESDDDFETKKKQHPVRKLSTSTETSIKKKLTPKFVLDKNLKVIGTINTQTNKSSGKLYNMRSTKVNVGNKIQQTSNSKTSFDHSSDDINDMRVHNKIVHKLNGIADDDKICVTTRYSIRKNDHSDTKIMNKASSSRKLDRKILSSSIQRVNPYTQWMQQYPRIEEQISKKRDIPMGTTFCQWERVGMIWWLLKTKKILVARSKKTWAQMREDGYLKHRSMRSLQNHFLRKILPNLQEFALPAEIIEEFRKIIN